MSYEQDNKMRDAKITATAVWKGVYEKLGPEATGETIEAEVIRNMKIIQKVSRLAVGAG